jgi:hypothetical protein
MDVFDVVFWACYPFVIAVSHQLLVRLPGSRVKPWPFFPHWIAIALLGEAIAAVARDLSAATGCYISQVVALVIWWWRRKGKRVAKLMGAKGKALIAGMLRKLREVSVPGPVPSPSPV